MRKIEYLSPSSINQFRKNLDEFYLKYLAETRSPKFPQDKPMSVGSAFDAYVKSFLHEHVFGKDKDPKFDFTTLFEKQVEPQNRDFAILAGKHAFESYKKYGALADLLVDIGKSIGKPRFELEVTGIVNGYREGMTMSKSGVTLLGKPDMFWINQEGLYATLDWKVNGWMTKASPMPGYINIRPGNVPHKDCWPVMYKGARVNNRAEFHHLNQDWAEQLTIYSWLCGVPVGEEFVAAIDQLVCKNLVGQPSTDQVDVRIAQHRLLIRPEYQWKLFEEIQNIWEIVRSPHIFRELSFEDNLKKIESLDAQAEMLAHPTNENDLIFNSMSRQYKYF